MSTRIDFVATSVLLERERWWSQYDVLRVPIRPGVIIEAECPRDITPAEAHKVAAVLAAWAAPVERQ